VLITFLPASRCASSVGAAAALDLVGRDGRLGGTIILPALMVERAS
jgi:hypothetical protein